MQAESNSNKAACFLFSRTLELEEPHHTSLHFSLLNVNFSIQAFYFRAENTADNVVNNCCCGLPWQQGISFFAGIQRSAALPGFIVSQLLPENVVGAPGAAVTTATPHSVLHCLAY